MNGSRYRSIGIMAVLVALTACGQAQNGAQTERSGNGLFAGGGASALDRCREEANAELNQIDASIAEVEGRLGTAAAQSDDGERLAQLQAFRERRVQAAQTDLATCEAQFNG